MKHVESFKSMPATLGPRGRACFSIPDRSGANLDDARRNAGTLVMAPGAVCAGAFTDHLGETRAEGSERRASDLEANIGDAEVAAPEQVLGPLDAACHEVRVRRLPERLSKAAREM